MSGRDDATVVKSKKATTKRPSDLKENKVKKDKVKEKAIVTVQMKEKENPVVSVES